MPRPSESLTFTLPGAAQALGVSVNTIRLLIQRGDLPAMHIGRRVLISKAELNQWLADNHDTAFPGYPSREAS